MTDREKVIKWLESYLLDVMTQSDVIMLDVSIVANAIALLKEQNNCENCAIAIEDRQPVVRCRDCKHWEPERDGHCPYNHIFTAPDWFCADGERKDNDA